MKMMLVPIDFSDVTPMVVRTACDWAKAAGCRVHLLHVLPEESDLVGYESGMQLVGMVERTESPEDRRLMESYRQDVAGRGVDVTTRIVSGSPALEIIEEAHNVGASLIVMGSHRHGMLHHLLLGSVSAGVLRKAHCPVLVVPTPAGNAADAKDVTQQHVQV